VLVEDAGFKRGMGACGVRSMQFLASRNFNSQWKVQMDCREVGEKLFDLWKQVTAKLEALNHC
jgi:hypothetical protein